MHCVRKISARSTADTQRLLAEAKTIESKISALEKSRPEDRTLALLGIASTSARKLEGKVHLKNVTTQMAWVVPTAQQSGPPSGQPGNKPASPAVGRQTPNDVFLEGNAEDAAAIAHFVELRGSGVFTSVELTATSETSVRPALGGNFALIASFEKRATNDKRDCSKTIAVPHVGNERDSAS